MNEFEKLNLEIAVTARLFGEIFRIVTFTNAPPATHQALLAWSGEVVSSLETKKLELLAPD